MSISGLLAIVAICKFACALSSASEGLPPEMAEALEQNAAECALIDVTLQIDRKLHLTTEETVKRLNRPAAFAKSLQTDSEMRLVCNGGKIYSSLRRDMSPDPDGDVRKEIYELSSDGDIFYMSQRTYPSNPHAVIGAVLFKENLSNLAQSQADEKYVDDSFFRSIGFELPVTVSQMHELDQPRSRILQLLEDGGKLMGIVHREIHDGREVSRIEIVVENPVRAAALRRDLENLQEEAERYYPPEEVKAEVARLRDDITRSRELPPNWVYTFYVDPSLNYALVRSELRYKDGTLLERVECSDFEKFAGRDVYLPRKCVEEVYSYPPAEVTPDPITTRTFSVKHIELEPAKDEQFVIDHNIPGMQIFDRTDPQAEKRFVVEDDGSITRTR